MGGGEIAVLVVMAGWWRERINGGAVEDWWPVIDRQAELHAANSSGDGRFC
jgi:hypothetical protein